MAATRYQVVTYRKSTAQIETITRPSFTLPDARQLADYANEVNARIAPDLVDVVVPR